MGAGCAEGEEVEGNSYYSATSCILSAPIPWASLYGVPTRILSWPTRTLDLRKHARLQERGIERGEG